MSEAEDWRCRITDDPEILAGKPVVKGARVAVEHIVELLANGWTIEGVLEKLKREDVLAALKYAAEVLKEERVHPLP